MYVAIIPCDMGSEEEGIGGLGEEKRGKKRQRMATQKERQQKKTERRRERDLWKGSWIQANAPIYIFLLKGL